MAKFKAKSIDDFITKDLKNLGKEVESKKELKPKLEMLRYLVFPREFSFKFGNNSPTNNIIPVKEFDTANDKYNMIYVLFDNQKEIWRMYTTVSNQDTVNMIRSNKMGKVELICTDNDYAKKNVNDTDAKIKELASIKTKYKEKIVYHHLEMQFDEGLRKFVGKDIA